MGHVSGMDTVDMRDIAQDQCGWTAVLQKVVEDLNTEVEEWRNCLI